MIKDFKEEEITREDIYTELFARQMTGKECITKDFSNKIDKVRPLFKGKEEMEVLIRGTILFDKDYTKLFTFLNKTYRLMAEESTCEENRGLEECIKDLDTFNAFMKGEVINWFSSVENEYVNYTRVLNAYIQIELR